MSAHREKKLTGRTVLWIVLAFFAAVAAVNGAMVWIALETFPGVERPAPAERRP